MVEVTPLAETRRAASDSCGKAVIEDTYACRSFTSKAINSIMKHCKLSSTIS